MVKSKKDFYLFTHYRNLGNFLISGYIHSAANAKTRYSYKYCGIGMEDNYLELYRDDYLPELLNNETVAINVGQILNVLKSSCNRKLYGKTGNSVTKAGAAVRIDFKELIPITNIKEILFKDEEILQRYVQMDWENTIDLPSDALKTVNQEFLKIGNVIDTVNQKDPSENGEYDYFMKNFGKQIILMDFVYKNNLFDRSFSGSVPLSFDPFPLRDQSLQNLVRWIESIRFENNIPDFYDNAIFNEKEFKLWYSLTKIVYNIKPAYRTENKESDLVENTRQYSFSKEDVKNIGLELKKHIEEEIPPRKFLRELFQHSEELDLFSNEILSSMESESPFVRKICKLIHDLTRYGKDIVHLKKLLKDNLINHENNDFLDTLILMTFTMYIGMERLPKSIKMSPNWKITWDTFSNDMIAIDTEFDRTQKISILKRGPRKNINEYKPGESIKIDKKWFLIDEKKDDINEDENSLSIALKLKNNFSFNYYYTEKMPYHNYLPEAVEQPFLRWLLKKKPDEKLAVLINKLYSDLDEKEKLNFSVHIENKKK